jgi:hypothetical protein
VIVVAPKNTNNIEKNDSGLLFCPKYIISGPIKNISSSLIVCVFVPVVDMYPMNNPRQMVTHVRAKAVLFSAFITVFYFYFFYFI